MSAARRRPWIAAAVGVQLAIPAVALVLAPSQFGFQMYSGAGWTEIQMEDTDGRVHDLTVPPYVAEPRIDVDWTERLPERICEVETQAVRVTVERWRTRRSVACS
jgi:hypothetical protein